jgi:hypothetical protein
MGPMSNQNPMGGRGRMVPTLPTGEIVGTYETYPQAQAAVDVLARENFPVAQVSIVGSDLKSVERVTGKLTWGRIAVAGAATGAWMGIFFGLLIEMLSPTTGLGILIAAVLLGAGFGMLFGLVSYAITRRTRDYTSMTQVLASSYSIVVTPELATRARALLMNSGAGVGVPRSGGSFAPPAQHPPVPPRSRVAEPAGPSQSAPPRSGTPAPRYGEFAPPSPTPQSGEGGTPSGSAGEASSGEQRGPGSSERGPNQHGTNHPGSNQHDSNQHDSSQHDSSQR